MNRIRILTARRPTARASHLLSATAGMLALSLSAASADDLAPPTGYRNWFHVNTMIIDKASPLFDPLGGMHNVHVNAVGEAALKQGGPYPDGTVFLTDQHDFALVDGSYVEGALKALVVMVKDSGKYASTGGWGFQLWLGGDPRKPAGHRRRQAMLRLPSAEAGTGLRLLDLHSLPCRQSGARADGTIHFFRRPRT
jgi:hypothetical protein